VESAPDPLTRYAGLRKLLIQHAGHLAAMTGNGPEPLRVAGLTVYAGCSRVTGGRQADTY